MNTDIAAFTIAADGSPVIKQKFLERIDAGKLTRIDNPTSHLCVYFAAYDPSDRSVFIGHHKKSGLWLFNGGHMDPGESPMDTVVREADEEWGLIIEPGALSYQKLITITRIEHPEIITCEWHYDLWHFLPVKRNHFHPRHKNLMAEFHSYGWKSYDDAARLLTSEPTKEALIYLRNLK